PFSSAPERRRAARGIFRDLIDSHTFSYSRSRICCLTLADLVRWWMCPRNFFFLVVFMYLFLPAASSFGTAARSPSRLRSRIVRRLLRGAKDRAHTITRIISFVKGVHVGKTYGHCTMLHWKHMTMSRVWTFDRAAIHIICLTAGFWSAILRS